MTFLLPDLSQAIYFGFEEASQQLLKIPANQARGKK